MEWAYSTKGLGLCHYTQRKWRGSWRSDERPREPPWGWHRIALGDGIGMAAVEDTTTTNVKLLSRKRNMKPRVSDTTAKSLRAQVKRLEQQREFLSLLKPALALDGDVNAAYADIELQACDGSPVFAHKAVLVSSPTCLFCVSWEDCSNFRLKQSMRGTETESDTSIPDDNIG